MNTTSPSHRVLNQKPATWLCIPALLIGLLAAQPAQGALRGAGVNLVADVDLSIVLGAPPPPRHEVMVERDRPSHEHVWVAGYWAHRDGRHEWVAGHWARPPHGRTVWVEPRWEKRGRGYVFVEGYWAEPRRDHHDHR